MSAALIVQLVLGILAGLPELIQAVEQLHHEAGAGPQKKALVLDLLTKAIGVAQLVDPKLAKLLTPAVQAKIQEVAGTSIDSAVTVMNAEKPAA